MGTTAWHHSLAYDRTMAPPAAVDHEELRAIKNIHCSGHQRVEDWHADNANDAAKVKARVALARHTTREAKRLGDIDHTVGHRRVVLQQLAVMLGGRPHHQD